MILLAELPLHEIARDELLDLLLLRPGIGPRRYRVKE